MAKILLKNVRPYGEDEVQVLIDGGVITAIGTELDVNDAEVIDAQGKVLLPGLVDMHCLLYTSPSPRD